METTPGIDYQAVLADLEKKRDDLDRAIAGIRLLIGLPQSSSPGPVSEPLIGPSVGPPAPRSSGETRIPSDAFFGMSIPAAAHKFLSMRKRPATSPEIAEALEAGGYPHQSSNLSNTINTALTRNPDMFAKVKRGTWGLRSWYSNYRPKDEKDGD